MKRKGCKLFLFFSLLMALVLAGCGQISQTSTDGSKKETETENHKYVIGWSTIYLTPTWMQQTNKMLEERADYWKAKGVLEKVVVANANGDTSVQISQIENMISQKYDAILVVAGSSTALNPVIEKAMKQGITVIAFDSLPSTDNITSKINTDPVEWGSVTAQWLVEKLEGKGKIIAMNGPAGVQVSDDRWKGAEEVFNQYPDIEIVAKVNSEYNEGPALQALLPVLDANPDINGIFSQGGALSSAALKALQQKNMKLVPMPGENYNAYLKQWDSLRSEGFSSVAPAQPNWLSVLSLDQAIRALEGYKVEKKVDVKVPLITDDTLGNFVPNDFADDYFPIDNIADKEIEEFLGPLEKME